MHAFLFRWRRRLVGGALVALACAATSSGVAVTASAAAPAGPDFGSNVFILTPSMAQSQVQATIDSVSGQQVNNQFGTQRYAIFFEPGTYGSTANPLVFQVGYYTSVAGLGLSPNDVVINGAIVSFNQCFPDGSCNGLDNFWRSVSNLTLNIALPSQPPAYAPAPPENKFCANSNDLYAISQAAPIRRVHINGFFSLFDYCVQSPFTSGGFIADSEFTGSTVLNGSQQQFIVRNTQLDGWTNGVWNQVFSGDTGNVPPQSFGAVSQDLGGPPPFTTLATNRVTREAPFLYTDSGGSFNVLAPSAQQGSSGTTWASGPTPGTSIPINKFFIAHPTDSVATINNALHQGQNLILTPGVYHLDQPIQVTRPDTVVLGLGFPTLVPTNGNASMTVASAEGMLVSGVLFDAGPTTSPVLLQVGDGHARSDNEASDPSVLSDVFFRIGGATAGSATTALVVNSNNVILDDIWAWRADHGNGVGWTANTSDTGVIVNGNNVTAYGLFVEHFQKFDVIWQGENGQIVMFQNEMPYDPPTQAAWSHDGINGWAAIKIADSVQTFEGWGLGSYCFFHVNPTIHAAHGLEVPVNSGVKLHDLLTVSLGGVGVIDHVVNDTGGAAHGFINSAGKFVSPPVDVVSFP
jgi:hypothetical protein